MIYHFFAEVIPKAKLWKLLCRKQEGPNELHFDFLAVGTDQGLKIEPTYSKVASCAYTIASYFSVSIYGRLDRLSE